MSSISSISLCLPSKTPFLSHNRFNFVFHGGPLSITRRSPSHISLSASIAEKNSSLEFSWINSDKVSADDDYNGWAVDEASPNLVRKEGWRTIAVVGAGASVAAVLALLAYFSFSGFRVRIRSPFSEFSVPSVNIKDDDGIEEVRADDVPLAESQMPEETLSDAPDAFMATEHKLERIIVPVPVDFAQKEAVSALKKLKIFEDDVRADELCTRREYARWLVRANSQLERSRKHQLNPFAAICGSSITAFDDVGVEDPDFEHIQTLAEAGIIRSKLSEGSKLNGDKELINFSPDRFVSRQDLITWKAKIEYEALPGIDKEMARMSIGFLDVKEISTDALLELFADSRADQKSITRGVFGQSRRFQPSKPCTKAQAAVALTCGRVQEFVKAEISRLEAEKVSREIELRELRREILERGEIKQYWERKIEEERNRGVEVDADYHSTIKALEEEKSLQESSSAELVKQKAALECQEQLLSSLKAEVKEMSESLSLEKAKYIEELSDVQAMRNELQAKYDELLNAKSILEAEIEALRILRSWVEDEARKSQGRAKVLEEAGRRWKWDG